MHGPYAGFDSQAPWASYGERGYDLSVHADAKGWLPEIRIVPDAEPMTYVFVRSFDEVGVYTPAYAVPEFDDIPDWQVEALIYSLGDDIDVPTWMPVAIERAGFGYDATPNHMRNRDERITTHPDQTELVEV